MKIEQREFDLHLSKQFSSAKLAILILSALIAFAFVFWRTRLGIGLTPDSVFYLAAAESLAEGKGYSVPFGYSVTKDHFEPLTHWPPLYSLVLSFFIQFGFEPQQAARIVNLCLFPFNAILVAMIVALYVTKRKIVPIVAALLFVWSAHLIEVHSMIWSEPLFISLMLGGLFFASRYFRYTKISDLIIWALFLTAAFFSRYVGLIWVLLAGVTLFLYGPSNLKKKAGHSVLFNLTALIPVFLWAWRNIRVSGRTSTADYEFHFLSEEMASEALGTMGDWFFPAIFNPQIVGIFLLILFLATLFHSRRLTEKTQFSKFSEYLLLKICCYIGFLVFIEMFVTSPIEFNPRMLAPILTLTIILIAVQLDREFRIEEIFSSRLLSSSVFWISAGAIMMLLGLLGFFLAYGEPRRFLLLFGGTIFIAAGILLNKKVHKPAVFSTILVILLGFYASFYAMRGLIHLENTNDGIGYNSRNWRRSPVLRAAAELSHSGPVYTNDIAALYLHLKHPLRILPVPGITPDFENRWRIFQHDIQKENGIVVTVGIKNRIKNEASLFRSSPFLERHSFADGNIYQLADRK